MNLNTDKGLRYRQWVESRRAYVAKISNGRLGYVHMIDMSANSLTQQRTTRISVRFGFGERRVQ